MKDLFLLKLGRSTWNCLINFLLLAPECSMFKIHCSRGYSKWKEER